MSVGLGAVLSTTVFALVGVFGIAGEKADTKPAAGRDKNTDVKRSIGPDVVYSTSPEEGLKKQVLAVFMRTDGKRDIPVYPYSFHLKMIQMEAGGMGASNVAIVNGDNITDAIKATRWLFTGGMTADKPGHTDEGKKSNNFWLVAYLGTGWSTPPKWRYDSTVVEGKSIEFRFKSSKANLISGDSILYFYWVPLGPMNPGTFELSLVDTDRGRATLVRSVEIAKEK